MNPDVRRPAVFLDRDGVLIEDRPEYVRRWEDVEIFPQALLACRELSLAGWNLVVVTNQAGVGKGILTLPQVLALNDRILDRFREAGANILDAYVCPHHPNDGCDCRKPKPGMLLQASHRHSIALERSFFVGDSLTDMQAADTANVQGILVRTGKGASEEADVSAIFEGRCIVKDDLLAAAGFILSNNGVQG